MRRFPQEKIRYVLLLASAFLVGLVASWVQFGGQVDNYAYDWIFRIAQPRPWPTESALLEIDERTLSAFGGRPGIREPLARGLKILAAARPRAVAVDLLLADRRPDTRADADLAAAFAAFRSTHNLVLPCEMIDGGKAWEDPLPELARSAAALGHVHAQPDDLDNVIRAIPLEKATARVRRWALALEAYRVSRGASILESPEDVQVGSVVIPSAWAGGRLMRVRYRPENLPPIPRLSLRDLLADPSLAARFRGRVVFVGVTAQSEVRDRFFTPYSAGQVMAGLEIHANAYETIAHRLFLRDAPIWLVVALSALFVAAIGLVFAAVPGWPAFALAGAVLLLAHLAPYLFFTHGVVFSFVTPVAASWMGAASAAAWQYLIVRRRLGRAEAERVRYQQAMHFVTHEMRTPLTAIQGSSELMSRYALPEDKRKQIAQMINSESKRLGRMIEIFLNVERLSAGQMELKHEVFPVRDLMEVCVERVRPLGERKHIRITLEPVAAEHLLSGDRELMEYAVYNLLTNAVKYSPQRTEATARAWRAGERVHISVQDQGIGMDQKEVKQVFKKFYRTRRAEESGEAGTGIGLSIVEQIVNQHGGTIGVISHPGQGSCFTLVLPVAVGAVAAE